MTPEQIRRREPRERMAACERAGGHEIHVAPGAPWPSSATCTKCGGQLNVPEDPKFVASGKAGMTVVRT